MKGILGKNNGSAPFAKQRTRSSLASETFHRKILFTFTIRVKSPQTFLLQYFFLLVKKRENRKVVAQIFSSVLFLSFCCGFHSSFSARACLNQRFNLSQGVLLERLIAFWIVVATSFRPLSTVTSLIRVSSSQ